MTQTTAAHRTSHSHTGEDWAAHAREVVRRAGHHRGAAREALIDLLATQDCALAAHDIESELRATGRGGRPVGRASVYRALELLHDLGLLTKIEVGDGITRYELCGPAADHHHHHMVCDNCGALVPFDDGALEAAIDKLCRRVDFKVKEHDVTLRGVCADCTSP